MRIIVFYWRAAFGPFWLSSSTLPFDCFQRRPTRQKSIVFVGGAEVPCKLYLHSGGVHHLQDFAHRKMFPQGCMPFAPPEKSLRRPAKHFRRPKKVSADLRNIFAVRKKFPQPVTPFPRTREFFVQRLSSVNNSVSRNSNFSQRAEGFNHSAEGTAC